MVMAGGRAGGVNIGRLYSANLKPQAFGGFLRLQNCYAWATLKTRSVYILSKLLVSSVSRNHAMTMGSKKSLVKTGQQPERRQIKVMVEQEAAYQAGLRRRATDREEVWAYYLMFGLTLLVLAFIGVGSWVAR